MSLRSPATYTIPGLLGGAGVAATMLPYSTADRLSGGEGWRGLGAGLLTDAGRAGGAFTGAAIAGQLNSLPQSQMLRLAILLGAAGLGAHEGHHLGRSVGNYAFNPGNFLERTKRYLADHPPHF
jgi:hypothetical protein